MANSLPLVPEPSKGTKCDRDMKVKCRKCSENRLWAPLLLLLFVLPLLFIKAVASVEIDSDLVFDDGAANSEYVSHADQLKSSSHARHHSNSSRHLQGTKFYHEPSTSDHQIVAPVESPVEDAEDAKPDSNKESDTSFFGRISELGKRARRQLSFSLFGNDEESEEKYSFTTEGKGFLGLDSGDFFGWFAGVDRRNEKHESHPAETSSTSTGESASGETPQATTPHENKYRRKRSTASDDELETSDTESGGINGGDVENATDRPQGIDDDESDLDAAAAHRPGQLQHPSPDDEDYIGEAASGSGIDSRTEPSLSATPPADGQPRFYRITFTILEPFRDEYYNRNSEAFRQLSQDLSQAVNELYESVAGRQSATVVQIQETGESFSSLVTLDLGTIDNYNENQLREHLYRQIANFRRLGNVAASEENFNFRSFGDSPPPQCQPNETVCRSGECLPQETRCDGQRDCKDGSDEVGCKCAEGEFICDLTRCILGSKRCDGHLDCSDGTDEQDCPPPPVVCQPDEWQCDDGTCIDRRLRCNGRQDCPRDNSDERNCLSIPGNCSQWQFTCGDGACIDGRLRCDSNVNCPNDDSDEKFCRKLCGFKQCVRT